MAKFTTHYDNLKVSRKAPFSVIKAAYKALCNVYHPDKYQGRHDDALQIMKLINKAYAVLSDPIKRAEHDKWIEKIENGFITISSAKERSESGRPINKTDIGAYFSSEKYRSSTNNNNNFWIA